MQTYLLKKGVCPFTPPIDQYWHSFTRGREDAVNNQKIIWIFYQINNNTVKWNGSVTGDETGLFLAKHGWHKNPNGT